MLASKTERITVNLPAVFDPNRHMKAIEKKITDKYGPGFEIDSIEDGKAIATRQVVTTEVKHNADSTTKEVRLPRTVKVADGEKMAVKFADQYGDGWEMTRFEPFLGRATLTQLTPEVARCRGAAAVALGVKPWDVQVKAEPDGGFALELPRTYVPSKHDSKLEEVATSVVGYDGWYIKVDPQKLTARIIPSDPPTFPESVGFPMNLLGKGSVDVSPLGMILPPPGETVGETLQIDWTASAFSLLSGTPGSGKSVLLNALIAYNKANGSELVIIDDPSKSVDFMWCKEYVRDGGWGCDSDKAAVAALQIVYNEGRRRAQVLADRGFVNWLDMPAKERFTPIFIVVDEASALLVTDRIPSGIPKDHPLVREATESNLMKIQLASLIGKIVAEQRFVGMRMVVSTQVSNNTTGIPPSLKNKIGHKILQGSNPSKSAREQSFSDEKAVPTVPDNVKGGGKRAKGVGVADLEGTSPVIYKTFFATTDDYKQRLDRLGVAKTSQPAPTASEIAKFTPSLDDEDEREATAKRREAMGDPGAGMYGDAVYDENGRPLKGAALAAAQSRTLASQR